MKKISIVLLLLLILAGCSSKTIQPTTDEFLFSVNGQEITESDLFISMKLTPGSTDIIRERAQTKLLRSIVEDDEILNEKAQEILQEAKEMMGDNFDTTLSQNGFDSEEEYIEEVIKDAARMQIALKSEIEKDYESLKEKRPRKVQILEVEEKDTKKVQELLKADESFAKVSEKYAVEMTQYTGQEMIVSELSEIDVQVLNYLLNEENEGLVEEVLETENGGFIIANILSVDADELKDEAIEEFVLDNQLSQDYIAKLFVQHKFKIHDQKLHDSFVERYPEFVK